MRSQSRSGRVTRERKVGRVGSRDWIVRPGGERGSGKGEMKGEGNGGGEMGVGKEERKGRGERGRGRGEGKGGKWKLGGEIERCEEGGGGGRQNVRVRGGRRGKGEGNAHRLQFGHIPPEVFSHRHHLVHDTVKLLPIHINWLTRRSQVYGNVFMYLIFCSI